MYNIYIKVKRTNNTDTESNRIHFRPSSSDYEGDIKKIFAPKAKKLDKVIKVKYLIGNRDLKKVIIKSYSN